MHKARDFSVDSAALTPEALAERSWKRAALLEVIQKDIFNGIDLSRVSLDRADANPRVMVKFPEVNCYYDDPVWLKRGRSTESSHSRAAFLRCKSFTKLNPVYIYSGSRFIENCLEVLEDFVELALENRLECPQLGEEVHLWEKWPSLEAIWVNATLARGSWEDKKKHEET